MKISVVTITARENPRIEAMQRTLAGSLSQMKEPTDLEWIIVDEKIRIESTDLPMRDGHTFCVRVVAPLPSPHRQCNDKLPAHNSARNAGLAAATGDYVVFLNDCAIVTRGWVQLVADVARAGVGFKCKTFAMHDFAIPDHGVVTYRDHNDRLHTVPPSTVPCPCWGAPRAAFDAIGGFDLAYDGEDKGHDMDAVIRLSRVGLSFVSSERAYAISLRRTKNKGEISTSKEAYVGARNQKLLNRLGAERNRIQGLGVVPSPSPSPSTTDAGGARAASDPSPVPRAARHGDDAAPVITSARKIATPVPAFVPRVVKAAEYPPPAPPWPGVDPNSSSEAPTAVKNGRTTEVIDPSDIGDLEDELGL